MADEEPLERLFETWLSSAEKVRLAAFYHRNPGVVETVEGLALRLGLEPEELRRDLADHVRLGLLRERRLGDKTLLVFDPRRRDEVGQLIERALAGRRR